MFSNIIINLINDLLYNVKKKVYIIIHYNYLHNKNNIKQLHI